MKILGVPVNQFGSPFNKWWKRVVMNLAIGFVVALFFLPSCNYDPESYCKLALMFGVHDISQAFLHMLVFYKLRERYDWITHTRQRVWYGIVLHTTATFAAYFTVPPLYMYLVFDVAFNDTYAALTAMWVLPIAMVAFVMVLAFTGEFFKNWKKSLASEEHLKTQMMSYKYEALRNQVNPHFLLDSFSTLKRLVYLDQHKAVEFIQQMSNLYRHVLEVKDKEFIPLQDELEFLNVYLSLVQYRYAGQLKIEIDLEAEPDDLIIPLALQSLIEHAVESTLQDASDTVAIHVKKAGDHIEVQNSKAPEHERISIVHAGLKNLEQQYEFYSQQRIQYVETPTLFSVRIPVLKQA